MTVGDCVLYFSYDAAGIPMSVNFNGTEYFYTTNIQGDVTGIVNDQGQTVVAYTYDAWGNILSTTDTTTNNLGTLNPLRYRGYVFDQETNLYYLQSRYYNPQTGRFINADGMTDTGQGLLGNNMFAYCLNNPGNMYDPNGACSKFLGFLWKVDCGKATCKQSKNYNPSAKRVAVIYDGRSSGFLRIKGEGFKDHGEIYSEALAAHYKVESYAYTDMKGFVDAWNSLSGSYDQVILMCHGSTGSLEFVDGSITRKGESGYSFWDLNKVTVNTVHLYACNGATINSFGDSTAGFIAQLTGGTVYAVADGNCGYDYWTLEPKATDGGYWVSYRN